MASTMTASGIAFLLALAAGCHAAAQAVSAPGGRPLRTID